MVVENDKVQWNIEDIIMNVIKYLEMYRISASHSP